MNQNPVVLLDLTEAQALTRWLAAKLA